MVECTCFGRKRSISETLVKFDHPLMQVVFLTILIQKNLFDATIKGQNFFGEVKFLCRLRKKRYNVPNYNLKMRNNKGKKCPPSLYNELKILGNTQNK
jgi:hypothetical protein